jgi:hypothetical protein
VLTPLLTMPGVPNMSRLQLGARRLDLPPARPCPVSLLRIPGTPRPCRGFSPTTDFVAASRDKNPLFVRLRLRRGVRPEHPTTKNHCPIVTSTPTRSEGLSAPPKRRKTNEGSAATRRTAHREFCVFHAATAGECRC